MELLNNPKVTVAICSRNRAHVIANSLESLAGQTGIDPSDIDVLVVDNGSSDNTAEVAAGFKGRLPFPLRVVTEPERGLSRARNKAVRETDADIIIFLDDDAKAFPDWIAGHLEPYATIDNVAGVTGKVVPIWECERPEWVDDGLDPYLGCVDFGEEVIPLSPPHAPTGNNMSFRRDLIIEVGMFDVQYGFGSDKQIPGEDTEISFRLYDKGYSLIYSPRANIYHAVTSDRMKLAWFKKRIMKQGQFDYLLDRQTASKGVILKKAAVDGLLKGGILSAASVADFITGNRRRAMRRISPAFHMAGYIKEMLSLR